MTHPPLPDTRKGKALFERLAVLHRPDCAALKPAAPAATTPLPDEGEVARLLSSDEAGRYAIAARAIYEDLRRVVGQLAGLLILARLTARRDAGDLPEMTSCRDRLARTQAALAQLAAPGPLGSHRARLCESADLCAAIVKGLERWNPDVPGAEADFAALNARIRQAYVALESCSSEKAGLQMVDFSHACCSCGGH